MSPDQESAESSKLDNKWTGLSFNTNRHYLQIDLDKTRWKPSNDPYH